MVRCSQRPCRGCLTTWSSKIGEAMLPPGYDSIYSGVEQQLDILGTDHVGYAHKRFVSSSGVPFAIVGARPFSKVTMANAGEPFSKALLVSGPADALRALLSNLLQATGSDITGTLIKKILCLGLATRAADLPYLRT